MVHRTEADQQRRRDLADDSAGVARLLPWATDDGRPCYLDADGGGWLSATADDIEASQLAIRKELLMQIGESLDSPKLSDVELCYLAARLFEALGDAPGIAESRGGRLPEVDADNGGEVRS